MKVIGNRLAVFIFVIGLCYTCPAFCAGTAIDILMPGTMFGPGSPFSINLKITNSGPGMPDAMLFIALSLGAEDFWFFPGWVHYPPSIDWQEIDIRENSEKTWPVIQPVSWPSSCGEFNDAIMYAMVFHNGELVSNLAEATFSWSESPQPTSPPTNTPTRTPTVTPMPTITPSPTPFPSGPPGYVYIRAGTFQMGTEQSAVSNPCSYADEERRHEVIITRGFFMAEMEITREQWMDLAVRQPELPPDPSLALIGPSPEHPVQHLTWFESVLYANLLSVDRGVPVCYFKDSSFEVPVDSTNYREPPIYCNFDASGYRLPTDAEWEYACRAGTTSFFSFLELSYNYRNCYSCEPNMHPMLEQHCVYCANSGSGTEPAGSKLPNPWGLFDMHGNVWEWVWDFYDSAEETRETDPTGPESGSCRVQRGGAWNTGPSNCRSAMRHGGNPNNRYDNIGFRLVIRAEE